MLHPYGTRMLFQSTSSIQRKTVFPAVRFPAAIFQSTSSIQRKTGQPEMQLLLRNISIHFLYTEEDNNFFLSNAGFCISIHFLYTEEDLSFCIIIYSCFISIHFLYTEEDRKYQQMNILHQDILYLILT